MTINVGIDARSLNVRHVRGTGRYVYELLRNTTPEDGVAWTIFGHDCSLPLQIPQALSGSAAVFEVRGHRFQTWEQIGLPRWPSSMVEDGAGFIWIGSGDGIFRVSRAGLNAWADGRRTDLLPRRFARMCLPDAFSSIVGSQEYLRMRHGLDAPAVAARVRQLMGT